MALKFWLKFTAFFLTILTGVSFFQINAKASVDSITLQQSFVTMPAIDIFFYAEQDNDPLYWENAEITGTLDGKPLDFVSVKPAENVDGITYMILVDESTSVKNNQVTDIKQTVKEFAKTLGTKDRLLLITFGVDVEVILMGTETEEEIEAAIDSITNNQKGTRFYDAINKAIEISENSGNNLPERKAAFIISDAVDYNMGGYTVDELIAKLKECNLPIYALGLNTGDKQSLDTFGSIARNSGGNIDVVSSSISESFNKLLDYMNETMVVSFLSKTNVASQKSEKLIITFKFPEKTIEKTMDIIPKKWTRDDSKPYITSYSQTAPNEITIYFSKDVDGAGNKNNYIVKHENGVIYPVLKSAYINEPPTAVLTFDELYQGKYTIEITDVTDVSMEKNALEAGFELICTGETAPPAGQSTNVTEININQGEGGVNAAAIVAGTVALVLIIIIISYNVVKKRRGIVTIDGKVNFVDSVEVKHHFAAANPSPILTNTKNLCLTITDPAGAVNRVDTDISGSIFIGRSSMCNLYFDDMILSRQHFVIEEENGEFFISDLDTVNGTFLNGVKVGKRRKLQYGDIITAGQIKIVFENK